MPTNSMSQNQSKEITTKTHEIQMKTIKENGQNKKHKEHEREIANIRGMSYVIIGCKWPGSLVFINLWKTD